VPTIGYGTTRYPDGRAVTLTDSPCTRGQAEVWLRWDLDRCAAAVVRLCPGVSGMTGAQAALTDFVYNLGAGRLQTSTLRRAVNRADWQTATTQLRRWVRGGGRVLPGLVLRREAEARLMPGYVPDR
jgi:lysozyme